MIINPNFGVNANEVLHWLGEENPLKFVKRYVDYPLLLMKALIRAVNIFGNGKEIGQPYKLFHWFNFII